VAEHIGSVDDRNVDLALPHRLVEDVLGPDVDMAFAAADRLAAWVDAQRMRLVGALRDTDRSPMELLDGVHSTTSSITRAERRADLALVGCGSGYHRPHKLHVVIWTKGRCSSMSEELATP
jgi:hypothetical protein